MPGDWGEFREVVAIGREVRPDAGGRLIVLAVAIWDQQMVIYAAEQLPEFEPPNPGSFIGWQISDDVGTQYGNAGGSRSGRDRVMALSDHTFLPGPPRNATRLSIVGPRMHPGDVIEVDLTQSLD